MDDLKNYTLTELLKKVNDVRNKHDLLKKETIEITNEIDNLEEKIKKNLKIIDELEKEYVLLIEEFNNRK